VKKARRVGLGAGAVALATAGVLAVGAPAEAASITALRCESGDNKIRCDVYYTGVSPIRIQWSLNSAAQPGYNDRSTILFDCTYLTWYRVKVVVTDAAGSASRAVAVRCERVWP
jgi:hypothetical protein